MYLVTGGTGFLGQSVMRELVSSGKEVVSYSRSGSKVDLGSLSEQVRVVAGDIADLAHLIETIRAHQVQYLIHLAYFRDIQAQEKEPLQAVQANCLGFVNILEAARLTGIKRVVWCSSAAVYGHTGCYSQFPVNEDAPVWPLNVYGMCKAFNENISRHYWQKLGVDSIALRATIVYGGGRYRGASGYAYDLFAGPACGQPVKVEHGDLIVDWVHVHDVAKAFVKACHAEHLSHRVFNICGHRCSVKEAAAIVRRLIPEAVIEVLPGQPEMWVPYLDSSRAIKELGYQPSYSLTEGFAECLNYFAGKKIVGPFS